jgi:hypothetical protein
MAALLGVAPASVSALEFDYMLFGGMEYHDNINLSQDDPQEEWIRRLGTEVSIGEESRWIFLDLEGRLFYDDYAGDAFDDEPRSELQGRFAWRIIPRGLEWRVEAIRTEEQSDIAEPPTPDNLERVDVLWTGPEATFRLTPVDEIQIGARYGWIDYEDQTADSERRQGHARWIHRLSPHSSLSANYDALSVEYEEGSAFGDFDQDDLYLSYLRETEVSTFQVDGGTSRIQREGRDDVQGYLAAARVRRDINSTTAAWVSATHRYTDSGARLLTASDAPAWEALPAVAAGDDVLFEERYAVALEKDLGSAELALNAYHVNEDFEASLLDRRTQSGSIQLGYALSQLTSASLRVTYTEQDYLIIDRRDEDRTARLRLERLLSPRWTLSAEATHYQHRTSVPGDDYDANVGLMLLRYDFRP